MLRDKSHICCFSFSFLWSWNCQYHWNNRWMSGHELEGFSPPGVMYISWFSELQWASDDKVAWPVLRISLHRSPCYPITRQLDIITHNSVMSSMMSWVDGGIVVLSTTSISHGGGELESHHSNNEILAMLVKLKIGRCFYFEIKVSNEISLFNSL